MKTRLWGIDLQFLQWHTLRKLVVNAISCWLKEWKQMFKWKQACTRCLNIFNAPNIYSLLSMLQQNNKLTAYKLVTESQLTAVCWSYTGLVDTAYDCMVKEAGLIPSQHRTSKQLEWKVLKSLEIRRAINGRNHSLIVIKYEQQFPIPGDCGSLKVILAKQLSGISRTSNSAVCLSAEVTIIIEI